MHSATIGGVNVHNAATILATHLQQKWDPRSPTSKPCLLSCLSKLLTSFVNCVAYRVYCVFPSKSCTSPFNTSGYQNKYRDNDSTRYTHILDGFAKTFQGHKLFSSFWWPLDFMNSNMSQSP